MSQEFAGLVIVAIAGNAVENVVGVQLAGAGRIDFAISVIINSALQIALFLTPLLVFVGAQDPILALLREVHVLPPFARVELKPVPRVYRVQITPTCQRGGQCSAAILLDALR